jgi:rod shape-determining protein MreC
MFKFFFKNIPGFFLVLILIICLWLLTHRGSNRFFPATSYKITALDAWLPIQKSVDWLISFPENTFNAIRELRILQQENSRLQIENQSLHIELSNQKSLESELAHLKEMLQIKAKLPHQAKIAHIIAHDPSTWNKSFVIDLGSEDGVQIDSPVISEQGIVGRVLDVTPNHSRVLLLSDKESSISGIDQRSRVTGIVLGTSRNELRYGYVSSNEDIQNDDLIVSSGLGGIYPKGYLIGTVVSKTQSENGLNADIRLIPSVDFAALDYVFVLPPISVYE